GRSLRHGETPPRARLGLSGAPVCESSGFEEAAPPDLGRSLLEAVRREGLEPPTRGLEGRRSVHLSYRRADQADQGERYQPGLRAATDDEVPEGPIPPQPPPNAGDEVAIAGRS